jgi:hypothetical protein
MLKTFTYQYGTVHLARWDALLPVALELGSRIQWFPVRTMCRILGVREEQQVAHLKEAYPDALREVPLQLEVGWRSPLCIRRKEMALWVAGIDPRRCKLEARGPLEEFRRELLAAADQLFWRKTNEVAEEANSSHGSFVSGEFIVHCDECGMTHRVILQDGVMTVIHEG